MNAENATLHFRIWSTNNDKLGSRIIWFFFVCQVFWYQGPCPSLRLQVITFPPIPSVSHVRSSVVYFLRKEQPSVSLALPPVGWQRTVEQPAQTTTVWACEKTVVMVKQPGHLTSMKKDLGAGTRV